MTSPTISRLQRLLPLLAITLVLGPSCGREPVAPPKDLSMKIEKGKPFPPIVLPALEDGSPRSLADFRGERILLHIFASW
jgi:hypothetical protein